MQNRLDMRLTLSASMAELVFERGCWQRASARINPWEEDDTEYDAVAWPAGRLSRRTQVTSRRPAVGNERVLGCHGRGRVGFVPARDPPPHRRPEGSRRRLAAPRAAGDGWRPTECDHIRRAFHRPNSILNRDDANRHRLRQRRIGHLLAGGWRHHRRDFRDDLDTMAGRDLRLPPTHFSICYADGRYRCLSLDYRQRQSAIGRSDPGRLWSALHRD